MVFMICLEINDFNILIEFSTVIYRLVISLVGFISFLEDRGPLPHFPHVWPISLPSDGVLETC